MQALKDYNAPAIIRKTIAEHKSTLANLRRRRKNAKKHKLKERFGEQIATLEAIIFYHEGNLSLEEFSVE